MKNYIEYYYNIKVKEINNNNELFYIKTENDYYIFKEYFGDVNNLINIVRLIGNKSNYTNIVLNQELKPISIYNDKKYMLIKLKDYTNYDIKNHFEFIYVLKDNSIKWEWEEKIEYHYYQMSEFNNSNKKVSDLFYYYIGLFENAIALYNYANLIDDKVRNVISHKRMKYPNYSLCYYDITNTCVDVIIRDIAEYYKAKYIVDKIEKKEIIEEIKKYNLSYKEIILLYARMLYFTPFFDMFENNIKKASDEILSLESRIEEYEQVLYEINDYILTNYNISLIDWIKKGTN